MKLGTTELIVILLIVVVLFGPTQIPKLSRMFGKSVRNFRDSMAEEEEAETPSPDMAARPVTAEGVQPSMAEAAERMEG